MNDHTDDTATTYGLVMPFVAVRSKGGPYDDGAYTAGWEMGRLWALLEHARPPVHNATLLTANVEQVRLIAGHFGYTCTVTATDYPQWSTLSLARQVVGNPSRSGQHVRVVRPDPGGDAR